MTLGAGLAAAGIVTMLWFVVFTRSEAPGETRHLIPSDLSARLIEGGESVELSWTAVDVEGVTLVVQRSESGGSEEWEDLAQFQSGTGTQTYTEPVTSTQYVYRIRSFDDRGGSGQTAVVSIDSP